MSSCSVLYLQVGISSHTKRAAFFRIYNFVSYRYTYTVYTVQLYAPPSCEITKLKIQEC